MRMTLLRATVHMVTPRDAAFLRPLMQPAIERNHKGAFGRRMGDVHVDAARVLDLLRDGPRTAREIAREIGGDEEAVANAVRAYAPIIQVPPRGVLGKGGIARYAPLARAARGRRRRSRCWSPGTCARSGPRRSWTASAGAG